MSLLDVLCPTSCVGCGRPGQLACPRCAFGLEASAVAHRPKPSPPGMPDTWVVSSYDGATRALLLAFKERGAVGLAATLGAALATAMEAALARAGGSADAVLVVPVPSSNVAVRRRGDDVVQLMARRAVRTLRTRGYRLRATRALTQSRELADSAGLSAAERRTNVNGGLAVRAAAKGRLRGARIVIVDDLVTTGATLAEARRALDEAGAVVIGAAAVAATMRNAQAVL